MKRRLNIKGTVSGICSHNSPQGYVAIGINNLTARKVFDRFASLYSLWGGYIKDLPLTYDPGGRHFLLLIASLPENGKYPHGDVTGKEATACLSMESIGSRVVTTCEQLLVDITTDSRPNPKPEGSHTCATYVDHGGR